MTITFGFRRRVAAWVGLVPLALAGFAIAALHPLHHEVRWIKQPGITVQGATTLPDN